MFSLFSQRFAADCVLQLSFKKGIGYEESVCKELHGNVLAALVCSVLCVAVDCSEVCSPHVERKHTGTRGK